MANRRSKRKKVRGRKPEAADRTETPAPGCAACSAPLVAGERFCRSCGAPVAVQVPQTDKSDSSGGPPDEKQEEKEEKAAEPKADEEASAAVKAEPTDATDPPRAGGTEKSPPPAGSAKDFPWARVAAIAGIVVALGAVAAVAIGVGGRGGGSASGGDDPYETLTEIEKAGAGKEEDEKPQASQDNGKLPGQTRKEMTRSVREVIRKHHQYVADGNYQAAFAMMSRRKKGRPLYDNPSCQDASCWGATMGPLTSGLTQPVRPSVKIIRTFKGDGVAEIKVRLPMPSCPNGAWEGITWARYERYRWTYDPGWKTNESQRSRYDGPGDSQDPRLLGVTCET